MKLEKKSLRALIDSGSCVTLCSKATYDDLKIKPPIDRHHVNLQSVNGGQLHVYGSVDLDFKIAGLRLRHTFVVASNLNRHIIIGRDFLVKHNCRLYFDLAKLRINNTYTNLDNDVHISSVSRVARTVLLKPRTVNIISGKIKKGPYFNNTQQLQLDPMDQGYLKNEPEIDIEPTIFKLNNSQFPVVLTNKSNKYVRLKKGTILGCIQEVKVIDTIEHTPGMTGYSNNSKNDFLSKADVSDEHRDMVHSLLLRNRDIFADSDMDLQETDLIEAAIETPENAQPINVKPYRVPLDSIATVHKAIKDMLEANIIRPSSSPWNFGLVVVDKKFDGPGKTAQKRICIDFRPLNKIIKVVSYPLPLVDDILGKLNGVKYFTSLDMRSGFWSIKLKEADREKTAFSWMYGKYEFNRLPFGLASSPGIYQSMANKLIAGLEDRVISYVDDILIYTKTTAEDHIRQVQLVFDRIRKHKLRLKLSKCTFLKRETKYLGFVITPRGVKIDENKIKAIRLIGPPQNSTETRSFLGCCSFFRKFIPSFSTVAEPMIALTRKRARFNWTPACQQSFEQLKASLTSVPMLAFPDPAKEYHLYTDCSGFAAGCCLTQLNNDPTEEYIPGISLEKPICFLSRKLSPTQQRYSTLEREAWALNWALTSCDYYIRHSKVIVHTDHQPLKHLLNTNIQNRRVQLWTLNISSYNVDIQYIPGEQNCSDLLSRIRHPDSAETDTPVPDINENALHIDTVNCGQSQQEACLSHVAAIDSSHLQPKDYIEVKELSTAGTDDERPTLEGFDLKLEQEKDPEIQHIKRKLEKGTAEKTIYARYMILDEILYYISQVDDEPRLRVFIPSHLQQQLIKEFHENGHFSTGKVFAAIKTKYYWPHLFKQIDEYVGNCVTCKMTNMRGDKAPLTQPGIPPYPMAVVAIDLSGPYRKTLSGNVYIASFVCVLTGYCNAWPIPDKEANTVLNILIEEFIPRHSTPLKIITDNGKEFINAVFERTLKYYNILHVKTSYYAPWSNSKVERNHLDLHRVIAKAMQGDTDTWDLHINQATYAINCQVSKTTGMSPFFALHHRLPLLPLETILSDRLKYQGEDFHEIALENQHKIFRAIHSNTKKARQAQAKYTDKKNHSKPVTLKVGDCVYYKNHKKTSKFDSAWKTHHIITQQTSPVSFLIRDQLTGRTIKAHANALKKANMQWQVPANRQEVRRTKLAYNHQSSISSHSSGDGDSDNEERPADDDADTQISNPPTDVPTEREHFAIRNKKKARDNSSSSDDDIPLFELSKRLRAKQQESGEQSTENTEIYDPEEYQPMECNAVTKRKKLHKRRNTKTAKYGLMKTLIDAVIKL